jgi:hypothetical protein
MNINERKYEYLFDVKIYLNDYYRTGESSNLNNTKYKINIYSFEYIDDLNLVNIYVQDLFRISTKLILNEEKLLKPTDMIEIKSLPPAKYILEVLINFNSLNLLNDNYLFNSLFQFKVAIYVLNKHLNVLMNQFETIKYNA